MVYHILRQYEEIRCANRAEYKRVICNKRHCKFSLGMVFRAAQTLGTPTQELILSNQYERTPQHASSQQRRTVQPGIEPSECSPFHPPEFKLPTHFSPSQLLPCPQPVINEGLHEQSIIFIQYPSLYNDSQSSSQQQGSSHCSSNKEISIF
jgi:hypothetical protein